MRGDAARPQRRQARVSAALPHLGAIAAAGLVLSGCQMSLLNAKGPVGSDEANILIVASIIMLAIIVPTMIGTLAFAWWFRASNTRAHYRPDWAFSGKIELVIWSVPFLTIVFLGGIAWIGAHRLDPAVPLDSDRTPLRVQVVSLDWKWLFLYPDQQVASVNELVVPAGTPVQFVLTSSSVWNAFFVPRLGSMIYTMRGMTSQLNLMADQEGTLHGLSTHFSGDGFPHMQFPVRAVSDTAFAGWVQGAKGGPRLDTAAYGELARQGTVDAPRTYGSLEPGLFARIVDQTIPKGPGPAQGAETGAPPTVKPKGGS
ncbi:ubiquinol oxidase subunit II [Methylobacterium nonmethylotrophicum]|uniref:Ubiquinol oxidase subunit 2 n=1 Tax=Methylobacterium nonmethylotrophicum TaxID=1141884 RepID=A0A4Z0NU12_9HYPH|nr:ubiquinol oxidase subunit II [Methylobacterium nonmethylotrophicum]TGE00065.1 ubiquinol oxidase subunit II [Methylobacterium nonmethylotrophicum]